jgi:hypothetical protein
LKRDNDSDFLAVPGSKVHGPTPERELLVKMRERLWDSAVEFPPTNRGVEKTWATQAIGAGKMECFKHGWILSIVPVAKSVSICAMSAKKRGNLRLFSRIRPRQSRPSWKLQKWWASDRIMASFSRSMAANAPAGLTNPSASVFFPARKTLFHQSLGVLP